MQRGSDPLELIAQPGIERAVSERVRRIEARGALARGPKGMVTPSCSRTNAVVATETSEPADAIVDAAASVAPSLVPATSASSADSGTIVLPPKEESCTTDAECGVTSLDVSGPQICCFRCCSVTGGRKSWTDRVEAICKGARSDCTGGVCACPSPPFVPKCIDGRCGLVYPPAPPSRKR